MIVIFELRRVGVAAASDGPPNFGLSAPEEEVEADGISLSLWLQLFINILLAEAFRIH